MSAIRWYLSRFALSLVLVTFAVGWALAFSPYGAIAFAIACILTVFSIAVLPSIATLKAVIIVLVLGSAPMLFGIAAAVIGARVLGVPMIVVAVVAVAIVLLIRRRTRHGRATGRHNAT